MYADKCAGGTPGGGGNRRGTISNHRSIEERPQIVEERSRIGDWEVDLILEKEHHGVALTLTEHKSRFK